jgi:hypothetical protein
VFAHVVLVNGARFGHSVALGAMGREPPSNVGDHWSGTTSLPGEGGTIDVDLDDHRAGSAPAAAAAVAKASHEASEERSENSALRADQPSVDTKPLVKPRAVPKPKEPAADDGATAHERARENDHSAHAAASSSASRTASAGGAALGDSGGRAAGAGTFGSEGPGGVRDLGRALTRAIPAASDTDPAWRKLAAGDAGEIEIAIEVDETGHISSWKPLTKEPPLHLVGMIRRTLASLEAGTFALRTGSIGAGRQVVKLGARVSDVVSDGTPSGPISFAFTYETGHGTASFTQLGGRHVEVTVRLLRIERPSP